MSKKFIVFNVETDAVEAIGTAKEVLDKVSETYGAAQLNQLRAYELVGPGLTLQFVLQPALEPA